MYQYTLLKTMNNCLSDLSPLEAYLFSLMRSVTDSINAFRWESSIMDAFLGSESPRRRRLHFYASGHMLLPNPIPGFYCVVHQDDDTRKTNQNVQQSKILDGDIILSG